ncbi:MAG: histidinol-phosphate transaminase [Clostridiales bacterium]|nr:histidinol-phosphate transaminase [Clostridiales bacterium]
MSRFLNEKYSSLKPYVPGEQPQDMPRLIKLNTNESPFPPSKKVLEVITPEQSSRLRLYSDPECRPLTDMIAKFYKVMPSNVITGNGSDEILSFCFQAFCPNGAVFADITYGFYKVFAQFYGIDAQIIPLRDDFTIEVDDYAQATGTVFIANPNAPTGIALTLDKIERLLKQNPERLVIVDEAYVDFGAQSAVELLPYYSNLLIVQTFSKSRSLAGARLGFAIGSDELIADLNKMKFSFNPYNVNRLSILAGAAAMADVKYFDSCRKEIMAIREYTIAQLKCLGFTVPNSSTNFIFAGYPERFSGQAYYDFLRSRGILVRHFGEPRTTDFVRITVGLRSDMDEFLSVTSEFLEGIE